MPPALPFTGDPEADELLANDPLALLIGMLLDQQIPMEKAFRSPFDLKERMGGRLDAAQIASMDPDELVAVFALRPALHRFPAAMAARTQELCRQLVEHYGGEAEAVWRRAATGSELLASLRALPGFGEQKARIFVALLAKRLGITPPGWQEVAGLYGEAGWFSVADVDGPEALARVREHKRAVKAAAKAKATATAKAAPAPPSGRVPPAPQTGWVPPA
ncbi:MAG: HhH-GPD-type base excision DNA repair protein [Acidimicrobiales bacterium]